MAESIYSETVSKISGMSNAELDQELEDAAILNEKTEMLLCCYLSAVNERRAFEDFGYSNIGDYAEARFGFGERKTRYLVALGRKIERLPKLREALASGKLGWCKASRVAAVASADNEAMWVQSALSMTVQQLEQRIKDGTDPLASVLRLPLTESRQTMWEIALEIYRRRAGAQISPVEVFELMVAEVIAEWGYVGAESEAGSETEASDEEVAPEAEAERPTDEREIPADEPRPSQGDPQAPPLPWAEGIDSKQVHLWEDERAAEHEFAVNADYGAVRQHVLDRDGWKCAYPGCRARANLNVHHIRYRSHGGCDAPWNLTVVCHFHHKRIHMNHIAVKGRAPLELEWTPPKLMREVLKRRRNNPSTCLSELDVWEGSPESRHSRPASAVT